MKEKVNIETPWWQKDSHHGTLGASYLCTPGLLSLGWSQGMEPASGMISHLQPRDRISEAEAGMCSKPVSTVRVPQSEVVGSQSLRQKLQSSNPQTCLSLWVFITLFLLNRASGSSALSQEPGTCPKARLWPGCTVWNPPSLTIQWLYPSRLSLTQIYRAIWFLIDWMYMFANKVKKMEPIRVKFSKI